MSWKTRSQKVTASWRDRAEPAVEAPVASKPVYSEGESALQGAGQAISMGYLPELQAAASKPLEKLYELVTGTQVEDDSDFSDRLADFRARDLEVSNQKPGSYLAGNVAGSVAIPLPFLSGIKGAGPLKSIARAGAAGAVTGAAYNPNADKQGSDTSLNMGERLGNAAIGGMLGGGAQGLLSAGQGLMKAVPKAVEVLQDANATPKMRENAAEVIKAAKALQIKPTPGMIQDSTILRGLESSLEQSPSVAGHLVRRQTNAAREGLSKGAGSLLDDASSLSSFETGERLKRDLTKKFGDRLKPAELAFDDLRSYTKDIELQPKPGKTIARNILNIPEVKALPKSTAASAAREYADAIQNAKTTQDVTLIRQAVGARLQTADATDRMVLGKIYDKLTKFEENSIKRGAIESARTKPEGTKIAKEMIGQMRDAKKTYAGVAQDIKELGSVSSMAGTKNPQTFLRSLESMKSEQLVKKLSNMEDVRMLSTLKTKYPEQFEVIRQKKIGDILEKSTGKNGIDIGKFLRATKSLSNEAKLLLFGSKDAVDKYNAIRTVFEAAPERMGPSGTPQGLQFQSLLSPVFQGQEMARLKLYQYMQTPEGQNRIRQIIKSFEKATPLAEKGAGLLQAVTESGRLAPAVERSRR